MIGDLVALIHELQPEVGAHDALRLHRSPKAPFCLFIPDGQDLVEILHFHRVHIGTECKCCHIGRDIVMLNHIGIERLDLALSPVHAGHPLNVREVTPGKARHTTVVDPQGELMGSRVIDEVIRRQTEIRVTDVCDRLAAWHDPDPPVQDHQAGKAPGENALQIKRLVHDALLTADQDKPHSAAVEPPPAQSIGHLCLELCHSLCPVIGCLHLRCDVCARYGVPLPGHVLWHNAHHILHNPIGAVE